MSDFFGPFADVNIQGNTQGDAHQTVIVEDLTRRLALEEAAEAIKLEADAYDTEHPGNSATGPMREAAQIVRRLIDRGW